MGQVVDRLPVAAVDLHHDRDAAPLPAGSRRSPNCSGSGQYTTGRPDRAGGGSVSTAMLSRFMDGFFPHVTVGVRLVGSPEPDADAAVRGGHRRHLHRPRRRGQRRSLLALLQAADHAGRPGRGLARRLRRRCRRPRRRSLRELLGRGDMSHLRHHASDERGRDRHNRQDGAPLHARAIRTCCSSARAAAGRPSSTTRRSTRPHTSRASLTFEMPERILADGSVRMPLDEDAVRASRRTSFTASGSRPSPSACSGRSSTQRTSCGSASCSRGAARSPGHAVARAQPEPARVPPRVVGRDRRVAQAADEQLLPASSRRRCATHGFGGRLLIMTSAGGVLDAARGRRAADPLDRLRAGRRPGRRPPLRAARRRIRHRARHRRRRNDLRRQPRPPRPDPVDARDARRRPDLRIHHRLPVGRRAARSAPAAARSPGSTRAACCTSGRRARAPTRARPATAGAARAPTVTDACLVLGYIDPDYFLGGEMAVSTELGARRDSNETSRQPLGLDLHEAASAILGLAMERMVTAIEGITLHQGIDPAAAVMIGGGGGAGLYSVAIARRLGDHASRAPRGRGRALRHRRAALRSADDVRAHGGDLDRGLRSRPRRRDHCRAPRSVPRASSRRTGGGRRQREVLLRGRGSISPSGLGDRSARSVTAHSPRPSDLAEPPRGLPPGHEELFAVRDSASPVELVTWRAHRPMPPSHPPTGKRPARTDPPATSQPADAPTSPARTRSRSMSEHSTR